jgi:hypothetical protein
LCLVETGTLKIIADFKGIDHDGGDPPVEMDEDGNEYIVP